MIARLMVMALLLFATPVVAQTPGVDSGAPIEIEADKLEVRQDKQLAIFTGNVVAIQGGMTLKTNEMRVTYRQDGKSGGAGVGGAISRLEALGAVVINTDKETATGERGVYDVDGRVIDLQGNVQLSNKDGRLTGQALRMDLASGVTTLAAPSSGRVRGVFTPQKQSN